MHYERRNSYVYEDIVHINFKLDDETVFPKTYPVAQNFNAESSNELDMSYNIASIKRKRMN